MRLRSTLPPLSCFAALAASARNLVFGIVPGETGSGGAGGSAGSGGTGGGTDPDGGPDSGGGGAATCAPGAASCEGAVLHACDAAGLHVPAESTPTSVGFLGNDNADARMNDLNRRAYVIKKSDALVLLDTGVPKPNERLASAGFADFVAVRDAGHWDVGLRAGSLVIHAAFDDANVAGVFGDGAERRRARDRVRDRHGRVRRPVRQRALAPVRDPRRGRARVLGRQLPG